MTPIIGDLIQSTVGKVVDKALTYLPSSMSETDKETFRLKAQELALEESKIDAKIAEAQSKLNEIYTSKDYGSFFANAFFSGWRPAAGWIGVLGLAYGTVGWTLFAWAANIFKLPSPPSVDSGALITLLVQMLGLSGLRTYERAQGVHREK